MGKCLVQHHVVGMLCRSCRLPSEVGPSMTAVAENRQTALRGLASRISSTLLKASRYTDLPALYQRQLFRQLSSEFYNQLWLEVAHNIGAEFERLEPGYICLSRGDLVTVVRGSEVMADNHLKLDLM